MAYDYGPLTATALTLITKYGSEMTFQAKGTVPDPITGLGGADGAQRALQGVLVKVDDKAFPETRVQAGDRMLLVEGASIAMSDKWIFEGASWTVEGVSPIMPNGSDTVAVKALVRA